MKKMTLVAATAAVGLTTVFSLGIGSAFAASYTPAQVAAHNTAANCWEVVNGKVYNLTAFVALHTGGEAVIIAQCGKDATTVFNNGPHSASSLNALAPYLVGDSAVTVATKPAVVLPSAASQTTATTAAPDAAAVKPAIVGVSHESEDADDMDESSDNDESTISASIFAGTSAEVRRESEDVASISRGGDRAENGEGSDD